MGLFNKFSGTPKKENENKNENEIKTVNNENTLQWFKNWWSKNDEAKWEESEQFLKKVGESFQEPKILELKNESNIELRAKCEDYPFRVIFLVKLFDICILEMKHVSPLGSIDLEYNPDITKENVAEVKDEWNENANNTCRLFLAKSVFIECPKSDIDETARQMSGFPPEFTKALINLIINNRIKYYRIRPSIIEVNFMDALIKVTQDPVNKIVSTLQMMALSAKTAGSSVPLAKGHADYLVTCTFCKSLQYFSSDGCCNCGAPFEKQK